ncbi:hypothetical protein DUI87_04838 [Hirundo rustica rustica]|uniref:Uncharacterized protein n=1 Tax=Hirundo rustica rustica TaxID=333673 RepID=A0A3M0L2I8_HIRRU|nr:hypothetical protein DUI87_04838 [Hirundo rustica rustica]
MLKRFVKNCGLWKGLTLEWLKEDYLLCEEPDPWSGLASKERVAETIHDEESAAPIPCPPVELEGEEVENLGLYSIGAVLVTLLSVADMEVLMEDERKTIRLLIKHA